MSSRKNKWRKCGALEFRRETKRYDDGTPWGHDVLFVRIKGKACAVIEPFDWRAVAPDRTLCLLAGSYSAETPLSAAHRARAYLTA